MAHNHSSAMAKQELDIEENGYRNIYNYPDTISSGYSGSTTVPEEPLSEKPRIANIPDERISSIPSRDFPSLRPYFDRVVPPHRRYFGHSRKYCLWVSFAIMTALFVFILGLTVALTRGQ
jgi:hypothetical protein